MPSMAMFFSKVDISFSSLCLRATSLQGCTRNMLDSVRISLLSLRVVFYFSLTVDIHSSEAFFIRAEEKKSNAIWINLLKGEGCCFCLFSSNFFAVRNTLLKIQTDTQLSTKFGICHLFFFLSTVQLLKKKA